MLLIFFQRHRLFAEIDKSFSRCMKDLPELTGHLLATSQDEQCDVARLIFEYAARHNLQLTSADIDDLFNTAIYVRTWLDAEPEHTC